MCARISASLGFGVALEQRLRAHDHAGDAVAALRGLLVDEGVLQRPGPRRVPRPSTVVTCAARRGEIGIRQENAASPSTITVQAPHWPRPQPNLAPFRREVVAQHVEQRRRRIGVDLAAGR